MNKMPESLFDKSKEKKKQRVDESNKQELFLQGSFIVKCKINLPARLERKPN